MLKKQFYAGFEAFWDARSYSASSENVGLWSVIYTTLTARPGIEDVLEVVRRGPLELIDWATRNSQRLDIGQFARDTRCSEMNLLSKEFTVSMSMLCTVSIFFYQDSFQLQTPG